MNFEIYEKRFKAEAKKQNRSNAFIRSCLNYAKALNEKDLPVIYDEKHLSMLLGIKLDYLTAMTNSLRSFYRFFTIPKSNGEKRLLAEPLPLLKEVQYFILNKILLKVPCSIYSKAYTPGSDLKSNARFHRNKPYLLKMDIPDYFPSLDESCVFLFFRGLGYNKPVSRLLAKLCTLNNSLPQGAPTSPYLSNLLTMDLDEKLYKFCRENGNLCYTRYADDITISGNMIPGDIIKKVMTIVANHDLKINKKKTVVVPNSQRQVVTGVAVNKKLQAPKPYRQSIRLEMHYCMKYGIDDHIKNSNTIPDGTDKLKYCQQMLGKINHCLQLNPRDKEMINYRNFMLEKIKE